MKQKRKMICCFLASLLLMTTVLSGCNGVQEAGSSWILSQTESYEKAENPELQVRDAEHLYDHSDSITTVYLAVAPGNAADGTDYTWTQINSVPLDAQGSKPYQCEGVFQLGDENAPAEGDFGYGQRTPNCTVRLQGVNASKRQQKSYRITIKDGMGSLDGMKSIVLSKSFSDPLRITNMLCYRLMEEIPELLSTRTCLVHLYVKDTSGGADGLYQDYGLYTMVEPVNKNYFKNRNLDDDGGIYKANNFDFARHEDVLVPATSPQYQQAAFQALLECKGDQNHTQLLEMLDAVNDPGTPIKQVIDTYFDAGNLYCWLAFNLLTGNRDTATENYYLYNPTGSSRFYFLSWDNDGAFRDAYQKMRQPEQMPDWRQGVFRFYDNVLFYRILQDADCVSDLSEAVDKLYQHYLTEAAVSELAEQLTALAEDFVYSLPDRTFARVTRQQYAALTGQVSAQITENYYRYYESLEQPAPFRIHVPQPAGDGLLLSWEPAVCCKEVTYTVELDDSWDFQTPLVREADRQDTQWHIHALPAGQYFLKVTAQTADGYSQMACETYATEQKTTLNGVLCFYVLQDGTVHASYFDGGD